MLFFTSCSSIMLPSVTNLIVACRSITVCLSIAGGCWAKPLYEGEILKCQWNSFDHCRLAAFRSNWWEQNLLEWSLYHQIDLDHVCQSPVLGTNPALQLIIYGYYIYLKSLTFETIPADGAPGSRLGPALEPGVKLGTQRRYASRSRTCFMYFLKYF